jgi:hypothetical protein
MLTLGQLRELTQDLGDDTLVTITGRAVEYVYLDNGELMLSPTGMDEGTAERIELWASPTSGTQER